jgi:hypothetical protein
LHRRLPGSELVIAERSGHWMGEPNIERTLVDFFRRLNTSAVSDKIAGTDGWVETKTRQNKPRGR